MCPKRVRPNRKGFPIAASCGYIAKPPPMSGVTLVLLAVLSGLAATSYATSSPNYNELGSDGGYKVFALEAEQDRGKFDCLWDSVASPSRRAAIISRYHADNLTPPLVCSARVAIFHNDSLAGFSYRQFFVDLRTHGASAPIPTGWSLELRGIDPNSRVTSLEGYGGTSASASNGTWTLSFTPSISLDEEDSLCEGHNQLLQGGVNMTSSCDTLHEPEWAILHTSEGSMHCYIESFQPSMSAWPNQCGDLLP
ncbi:hypothetical protein QOT17_011602 [Balamuthia mandrillaris]